MYIGWMSPSSMLNSGSLSGENSCRSFFVTAKLQGNRERERGDSRGEEGRKRGREGENEPGEGGKE